MGAKKDPKATSKTPAKTPKKKEGGGGKAKKKKWSKGKTRDKLNNLVLFDKVSYEKLYKEVPTYKLITPSIVSATAMLTTFNELDMSAIMQLRKDNQDAFVKKHGIKMGFMSAFVKASAYALTKAPTVNAVIDGQDTVYRDFVDISVAVATPKGLVVPVLRNVESMNYADIEKGIAALGKKAKNNQISIEDMDGGTFTISNGGVFGSLFGTPIINPPQSAILGMHGVFERPVVRNGQVTIRPMMYIALTYDHRLVDGREAVTFLRTIKNAVEDPRVMLMDL